MIQKELRTKDISELPGINFQLVADEYCRKSSIPLFVNGPIIKSFVANSVLRKEVKSSSVGYYEVKNVKVHGLGLFTVNNEVLIHSDKIGTTLSTIKSNRIDTFLSDIKFSGNNISIKTNKKNILIDEKVIVLSQRGFNIYGHWLIDLLPRLAFCERMLVQNVKVILPKGIPKYAFELLKYFGVEKNRIIEHDYKYETLHCKDAIIPSASRSGNDLSHIHPCIGNYFDRIIDNCNLIEKDTAPYLYLSRKGERNQMRRLINRNEVENVLDKFPFVSIQPEKLSFLEQFSLYKNAKIIIGEYGSALHNSLFGSKDLKVISLSGNHILSFIQHRLCEVKDQQIGYVFGEAFYKKDNRTMTDFLIDPKDLEEILETVF